MDLKVLGLLLLYYSIISVFFAFGGGYLTGYDENIQVGLNSSEMTSSEIDQGGLFGTGVSFGRFVGLVTLGIGLPEDTPIWFSVSFIMWQTALLIFTIGFVISSIWNG